MLSSFVTYCYTGTVSWTSESTRIYDDFTWTALVESKQALSSVAAIKGSELETRATQVAETNHQLSILPPWKLIYP